MNTKEAKDFLVQQVLAQADLEKVPLAGIEKRMMYFVENDPTSCENPMELNAEFEDQCNTAEYEAKMSRILHHAYDRIKKEDPGKLAHWKACLALLSKGDHYLPVLWHAEFPSDHPVRDFIKPLAIGFLIAVIIAIVIFIRAGSQH